MKIHPLALAAVLMLGSSSCASRKSSQSESYTVRDSVVASASSTRRSTLDLREALAVDASIRLDSVEIIAPSMPALRARSATIETRVTRRTSVSRTGSRVDSLLAVSSGSIDGRSGKTVSVGNPSRPWKLLCAVLALFGIFSVTLCLKFSAR